MLSLYHFHKSPLLCETSYLFAFARTQFCRDTITASQHLITLTQIWSMERLPLLTKIVIGLKICKQPKAFFPLMRTSAAKSISSSGTTLWRSGYAKLLSQSRCNIRQKLCIQLCIFTLIFLRSYLQIIFSLKQI